MTVADTILLKIGEVYFHAAFLDDDLTVPSIETYIYVGIEDGCYMFKDAEDHSVMICYELDKIVSIYDRAALSRWLIEEHSPKHPMPTEYIYKAI